MFSLAEVLNEKTDWFVHGVPFTSNRDVPDETIATLRNLGVPMPAPRRLGGQNRNTPISEPTIAAIRMQVQERQQNKMAARWTNPESEERIQDPEHNTYFIQESKLPDNRESIARELAALCRREDHKLNRRLLCNLLVLAHQGALDCVQDTCLNSARPDIALFSEEPVLTEARQSYKFSRTLYGNVTLISERFGKVKQVRAQNEYGDLETVDLDTEQSHFHLKARFVLDHVTGMPELDRVTVDYAFIPTAEVPERSAPTDETSSALEESQDIDDSEDSDSELVAQLYRLRI